MYVGIHIATIVTWPVHIDKFRPHGQKKFTVAFIWPLANFKFFVFPRSFLTFHGKYGNTHGNTHGDHIKCERANCHIQLCFLEENNLILLIIIAKHI